MSYSVRFDNGMYLGITRRTKTLSSVNDWRHATAYETEEAAREAIPSWLRLHPYKLVRLP